MKKTYFAYIRVSTIKQGERGSSLQEQKSAIEAYAARNGLTIAGWYEEMETAAKQGRRQFTQMMTALATHKAGGVIIHKIDRSARNLRDWANLGDLIDRGIDVRFVVDNFDLLSRGGRLSADIQAVVASDFIRNLKDEVKKGMYGRLKQGLYPWKAPMGYLDTGKGNVKVIDPVKGPLVRLMFEQYATNTLGFHALRREMYACGLRTQRGKILPVNAIHLVLNNPFYIGVIRMRAGDTYPGIHEPLISKALFDRVQTILRNRSVPKSWKNRFLLRQMVKCDHCGRRTLTGELQKGTLYYRCHSHSCRGMNWRGDHLEQIALDHIRRIRLLAEGQRDERDDRDEISNTEPIGHSRGRGDEGTKITPMNALGDIRDLRAMVDDVCKQQTGEAERFKHSLQLRLQQIDDRIARLTDLLIDEVIDRAIYNERKEQLLMDRQGVLEEISRINGRSPLAILFDEFELNNAKLLQYELMTDDEKRELIDIVCSNFSVCGNTSTFTLRSPYKEMSELNSFQLGAPNRNDLRTRQVLEILEKTAVSKVSGKSISEISSLSSLHPSIDTAARSGAAPFIKAAPYIGLPCLILSMSMKPDSLPSEFTDPRLVAIFDTMNSIDWFQGFYPKLAAKLGAKSIVDIGCGTGLLTCELAKLGYQMTGLEPSAALLELARKRPEGRDVKWIEGYVDELGDTKADLAIMTGHVAQFFLEDEDWRSALRTIRGALHPNGHLAFESRNPLIPPFADWPTAASHKTVHDPVMGDVEWWFELLETTKNRVQYKIYDLFVRTGEEVSTTKELAFRSQDEIVQSLQDTGFSIEHIYGDWDESPLAPTSPEMIFVARA